MHKQISLPRYIYHVIYKNVFWIVLTLTLCLSMWAAFSLEAPQGILIICIGVTLSIIYIALVALINYRKFTKQEQAWRDNLNQIVEVKPPVHHVNHTIFDRSTDTQEIMVGSFPNEVTSKKISS